MNQTNRSAPRLTALLARARTTSSLSMSRTAPRTAAGLLGLLGLLAASLQAEPGESSERPYHFVQKLSSNVAVNWSTGFMYARLTEPVRKAEGESLTEARLSAMRLAKEKARAALSRAVLLLPVDAGGTYGEHMGADPRLRQDFETIERDFRLIENTTGEGTVRLRMGLPLFGRTGLLRRLPLPENVAGDFADVRLPVPTERYTGLIVFTELAQDFRPSLRPALALPGGDRFLTIENRSDSRGFYFPDEPSARSYGRVGDRPLRLFAPSALSRTDLVIDRADAQRILGNAKLFRAIREGHVAIVTSHEEASTD